MGPAEPRNRCAVCCWQNRAIDAAQVIEELIDLAKELREAERRGEKLRLTEEVAFYSREEEMARKERNVKPRAGGWKEYNRKYKRMIYGLCDRAVCGDPEVWRHLVAELRRRSLALWAVRQGERVERRAGLLEALLRQAGRWPVTGRPGRCGEDFR